MPDTSEVHMSTASCRVSGCDWRYRFERDGGRVPGPVKVVIATHLMLVHGYQSGEADWIARNTK